MNIDITLIFMAILSLAEKQTFQYFSMTREL